MCGMIYTGKPCCGRETARCRCKIRYVSKCIVASRGPPDDSMASCFWFPLPEIENKQLQTSPVASSGATVLVIESACHRRNSVLAMIIRYLFFFSSSSANIQQWPSPFTAGVSWLSRPDQLTRLQTTNISKYFRHFR